MKKNNIAINLFYALGDKFGRMAISFLLTAYIARTLTKDEFGIINYGLTISSLAITFSWIISADIVVKMLAQYKNFHSYIIDTSFWARTILSIITFLFYLAFCINKFNSKELLVLLFFSSAILLNPFSIIHSYFRYKTELTNIIKLDFLTFIFISIAKFLILYITKNVSYLAAVFILEYLSSALIFLYLFKKDKKCISFNISIIFLKKMTTLGWPLLLSASVGMLFIKIDRIMIAELCDTSKLADYFIATNLTEVWWSIPTIFIQVISAKMIYLANKKDISLNYKIANKIISLFFIITTLLTILCSSNIITFVYGYKFVNSSSILNIYIICSIFVFWDLLNMQLLIKNHKTALILYKSIIGLLSNIILSYYLITNLGIIGAAIGTLLSYFICWLFIILIDKTIRSLVKIQIFSLFNPLINFNDIKIITKQL
ncbi:oligosaccharide flippase family protein [Morganella morganii]|uniref:oligosaccharide flippase family protein n=2 Tax=Enterobacterales TaxID=91347 RepID=UPI00339CBCD0